MADLISMLAAAAGAAAGGGEVDPNFNQTVLLLHGDGTNGAQNNTFLDSSTNNFTITRNGNTTQGTFSPFSLPDGRWSNYFDGGASTRLTFADSADWNFTGDFTIDFWCYTTALQPAPGGSMVSQWVDGGGTDRAFSIFHLDTGEIRAGIQTSAGSFFLNGSGGTTFSTNEWHYVCFTLSGTTLRLHVDGTLISSTTTSGTHNNSTAPLGIGAYGNDDYPYKGYLSNVRIINGTALSGAVPTEPLSTSTTNQKLLTCYSNRFVDANTATTAKTATVYGNVKVTPFSPFAPTAAYDASVNGGSGYFDGTGDYLTAPDDAAFEFGSGDFTIEVFVYVTVGSKNNVIVAKSDRDSAGGESAFAIQIDTNNKVSALYDDGSASWDIIQTSPTAANINAWNHIVATRSNNDFRLFLNGVLEVLTTSSITLSDNAQVLTVGILGYTSSTFVNPFSGYISNLRLVKGSVVSDYSTASTTIGATIFTPPTAPLTAVSGTSLLLNFTNAGIFDQTGKNVLETVGNAQIDTTTKKYGTGSMEFDGTGDYLVRPYSQDIDLNKGDFTIEAWVYPTGTKAFSAIASMWGAAGFNSWILNINNGTLGFAWETVATASNFLEAGSVSLNTWSHVAAVRSGNTFTIYLNGVSQDSDTSSDNSETTQLTIGAYENGAAGNFQGFIDDLRITKGVARYTAAFTPPTKEFPNL